MTVDEIYMKRCLELAQQGQATCAPNPMVGAVIVHDNQIIGEGYHQKYGEAHAEVNAVKDVSETDQHLLPHATLYVNLEPCAHYGKTPPCSQLIIDKKIKKVVIGCTDSFSEVNGKGIEMLQNDGVEVQVGVLEQASRELNQRFFTFHEQKRPFVILKMATSINGKMDIDRSANEKGVFWITSPEFQAISHQWRHEEQAILVGYNTVITDNPSLTVRAIEGRNPTRVVITKGELPADSKVLNDEAPTLIMNPSKSSDEQSNRFVKTDGSISDLLHQLYQQNINSVIVEGGPKTLQKFLDANLWDEARVIQSKEVSIEKGTDAPVINASQFEVIDLPKEQIILFKNTTL